MFTKLIDFVKKMFVKYRELITYVIFGALTTAVNYIISNFLFYFVFSKNPDYNTLSNTIGQILSIIFAYVTNRIFVFQSKTKGKKAFFEIITFFAARALGAVADILLMNAAVDLWGADSFWLYKIIINVVIIIVNYVLSKLVIFRKQKNSNEKIKVETEIDKTNTEEGGTKDEDNRL